MNGHDNFGNRQFCGQCGVTLAAPSQQPHTAWFPATGGLPPYPPGFRSRRWLLPASACVAVVVIVASLVFWFTHRSEQDRWSAFPQTTSCSVVPDPTAPYEPGQVAAPLPESTQVQQVTLTHPGGQQVEVAVTFSHGAPPESVEVRHPALGAVVPVTLNYGFDLLDFSRSVGAREVFVGANMALDGHWQGSKPGETVSATQTSDGFTVVIDASVQLDKIGTTPWRPSVMFNVGGTSAPNSLSSAGESWSFDSQWCFWTERPAGFDTSSAPTTATTQTQTPSAPPEPRLTVGPPLDTSTTAPTGSSGADSFVFQSPSGNIACRVGPNQPPGYALCDVGEHDFSPACPQGSEIRLALQQGDGPRFEGCTKDSLFTVPHVGLLYGGSWRSGSITCNSDETGITCTDASTGHFFQLARQSYQVG